VDLYVEGRSRWGRDMCKPRGRWVNPAHGSVTGGEGKDVYDTVTGRARWVALKRVGCGK